MLHLSLWLLDEMINQLLLETNGINATEPKKEVKGRIDDAVGLLKE